MQVSAQDLRPGDMVDMATSEFTDRDEINSEWQFEDAEVVDVVASGETSSQDSIITVVYTSSAAEYVYRYPRDAKITVVARDGQDIAPASTSTRNGCEETDMTTAPVVDYDDAYPVDETYLEEWREDGVRRVRFHFAVGINSLLSSEGATGFTEELAVEFGVGLANVTYTVDRAATLAFHTGPWSEPEGSTVHICVTADVIIPENV